MLTKVGWAGTVPLQTTTLSSTAPISIEELYQAFKERMEHEAAVKKQVASRGCVICGRTTCSGFCINDRF